ncbi:hypothetical protein CKO50_20395 [Pseudoalteromonas sp. HM-SA03]|uniref:hypothetical protein n=1 Tax=Pseudoalteromonas sp. HM-SA03 TaxID=2029678 RepID=UPI000BAE5F70|nr:hypothetical protein [Pseudoalteromonas sp. HM-SA03]PAX99574.1 hypothetical protein CKO50_20395 [Pseudoalteromonas sp. HM-SA03]
MSNDDELKMELKLYPELFLVLNGQLDDLQTMQNDFSEAIENIINKQDFVYSSETEQQFIINRINREFEKGLLSRDDLKEMCKHINNIMYFDLYDLEEKHKNIYIDPFSFEVSYKKS